MIKRARIVAAVLLGLAVLAGSALAMRRALLPVVISWLPAPDLSQPDGWLLDWRIASLRYVPERCAEVLRAPFAVATPVPDHPITAGCGSVNAVRATSFGGARLPVDRITCEAAAALALWIVHDVQPLAEATLGQRVTGIQSMGAYSCRNIIGSPLFKRFRSQHARANAIDIGGFVLADGRHVTVKGGWKRPGADAAFLRAVHDGACRYFRVVIGPDYNDAHHDHIHLDRGWARACR